ncbi:uncharacterized protein KRP23_6261 [Phytophthora ramorum]|uniref:uncharacterized protein n=1 Tax=Phytophthora ramorum TaxID=164328 RepID=UPI0030A9FF29|nr:hypothetical protein KRP23_6261 [Phytophthora ramorum]
MAAGTRDRDSAGRLLRVLQDCELFHMEAAITSLDRVKNGIRSESLLKPSGSDDVDVLERTGEGRVLSLSDHKRIARLQAALSTVADAYEVGNEVGTTAQNRNLVCAVAAAAIMQATRDCTASRTNCCIWGPQAEKLHVLLNWMVNRECAVASLSHDFVRELLLDWIQPIAEKQNQLAACLALFELLQRRRRKMMTVVSGSECPFLLGDRAEAYMDALRGIIERGVRRVADSQRVKLSKLALIALEALALLCGDIAAIYLMSDEATKRSYASKELMHKMVTGVRFFLTVLRQWHLDSTRHFIISRELFITEIVVNLQDFHIRRIRKIISLVRTFIYQLDGADTQVPLYRHWRRQLTPVLLGLIDNENDHVRRLALSCLPSLDPMSCIAGLCAAGVHDTENLIVTSSGGLQTSKVSSEAPGSPRYWNEYDFLLKGNTKDNNGLEELQEKLLLLCFGPNGWNKYVQFANARSKVLSVLLRKIFGSPRDTLLFRMLRQFVACGWVDEAVFQTMGKQLTAHMMNLQRLSEDLLDDTSSSAAKATEGLLFSRLAPFLVLRMLPRQIFGYNCATTLACGREDLDHLNEYIDHQRYNDPATAPESDGDVTNERLFHILAFSVVDPLEFKEVKMLATEGLAKFPPPLVLPFAFAYLIAFLREATPHHEQNSSLIVSEEIVPDVCGLVTAKLMVYYLNRVFSEDMYNGDITSKALVVLVKILGIPCAPGSSFAMDESLLIDLQRGCIDCIASILTRLTEDECEQDSTKLPTADGSSLLNLLVVWIFGGTKDEPHVTDDDHKTLGSRVQTLFVSVWSEIRHGDLPLQLRVCCCNVLLSAISRSDNNMLASWKAQRLISRVALAIEHCSEDGVVAGGLQVIFAFLYKASELLSMENNADLQLVRICFEIAAARLEVTQSESVAMSGLKVVGALVGKLPAFIGALPPAELQRLIDSCLISLRDRQVSPAVSNLAQSLLQAMTSS